MSFQIRNLIKQYLQSQLYQGNSKISLRDDVRPILRSWMMAKRAGIIAPKHSQQQDETMPVEIESLDKKEESPDIITFNPTDNDENSLAEIPRLLVPIGQKADQMQFIVQKAFDWLTETKISTLRNKLIFSAGSLDASIMIVNEYPTYLDEKNNNLLTGPAGEKFTQILKAMGLSRNEIYLTNLVKYRPEHEGQTTNTRPPTDHERFAFSQFIKAEAQILKPKVILVLGESSAQTLLENEAPLTALKGVLHPYHGHNLVVTYHPGFLLQSDSKEDKRSLWEDMLLVMEQAQLPISEKQKRFFL